MRPELSVEDWLNCVGEGWHGIVRPLVEKANAEGASIAQIKEKFGGLRFYVDGGSDELHSMIDAAQERSAQTCEKCGKQGKRRSGGWIKTLCDEHETSRARGRTVNEN